ncbi:MAG: tRNA pseudouridine(55) synthase TruB [Bacteroidales bacterium]|nr:tRNA pseudouridine(55) synthase TruB [Bacteroidales bacterium]
MDLKEGGYFLIDKPYTWTSFQVVNKLKSCIRRATGEKKFKIGHAGTLDPLATGLLIVCLGKYTKKIDEFQGKDKEYTGTFHLGATTKSFDMEHPEDAQFSIEHITEKLLKDTANSFLGEQEQVPPVYSAVKIGGRRAYHYVKAGEEVEMKKRNITISDFELTNIALPDVDFRIACTKGTYIRSIARDFGLALDSGAYLSALRRIKIGEYTIEQAYTLSELEKEILENNLVTTQQEKQ